MRVFVSSQAVDGPPASLLIARLRSKGWTVSHSPSNPLDAADQRWPDWYERGLAAALDCAEVFIAVLDEAWDSSTWMAVEADVARRRGAQALRCYAWSPHEIAEPAPGMKEYLDRLLPQDLDAAVAALEGESAEPLGGPGSQ